jgi:hypothetical protein
MSTNEKKPRRTGWVMVIAILWAIGKPSNPMQASGL